MGIPYEAYVPKFIKDLGMDYPNPESKNKIRYGLYECPFCGMEFKANTYKIRSGNKQGCGCISPESFRIKLGFIEEANKIHNFKYDYSLTNYTLAENKVKIICPIHGVFEQLPLNHLRGSKCKKCADLEQTNDLINFIEKANKVHNFNYDYSLTEYTQAKNRVKIICPIHGIFEQRVSDHLSGNGCPNCAIEARRRIQEDIIQEFKSKHKDLYDYSQVEYKTLKTKVKILCKEHGIFEQAPDEHRRGSGCPYCANIKNRLQYHNIPTYFYVIKVKDLYKIGITMRTVEERYKSENIEYEIIFLKKFEQGFLAYTFEQWCLSRFYKYLYMGDSPFSRVGITEIFIKDITQDIKFKDKLQKIINRER